MMNVCWWLLLLFELITGDVIDANGNKSPARKQTLRANKSDQVTPSLDFGVLELGAYLERKTSPALVLANARDAFCHGSHCNYGHRENLIIRDNTAYVDVVYIFVLQTVGQHLLATAETGLNSSLTITLVS